MFSGSVLLLLASTLGQALHVDSMTACHKQDLGDCTQNMCVAFPMFVIHPHQSNNMELSFLPTRWGMSLFFPKPTRWGCCPARSSPSIQCVAVRFQLQKVPSWREDRPVSASATRAVEARREGRMHWAACLSFCLSLWPPGEVFMGTATCRVPARVALCLQAICSIVCQKEALLAWISNYIPHNSVGCNSLSMALCKTAVTPVHWHWSYGSLALSHCDDVLNALFWSPHAHLCCVLCGI